MELAARLGDDDPSDMGGINKRFVYARANSGLEYKLAEVG